VEVGSQTMSIRPKLIAALLFTGAAAAIWLATCVGIRLSDNVHVVESGLAVRSGQLWPAELEMVIADYQIRSIISLVPAEPEQSWYRDEIAVSLAHGVSRYEMPLAAGSELTSDQLRNLVALLREAPKPMLIHSKSGADRSGLAAAIFQYAIASRSADEAGRQLSIRYGHLPYIWNSTAAMDASFKRFVAGAHNPG
jgi:protein tyrosine/serine phosphatase